jgi:hypothetical protein
MTRQASELIDYQGQSLVLHHLPLDHYFEMCGIPPPFDDGCSFMWRGYAGTWEIKQNRLYLIGLRGFMKDGGAVTLESIFPGYPERVFAHWYSGPLSMGGYKKPGATGEAGQADQQYEIHLRIEKGILVQIGEAIPKQPTGWATA